MSFITYTIQMTSKIPFFLKAKDLKGLCYGNSGWNVHPKDRGGVEGPPIAQFQFEGQPQ